MEVSFNTPNYKMTNSNITTDKTVHSQKQQGAVKSFKGLSPEQINAIKSQIIAAQNLNKQPEIPHITEKDIDMQVCCVGCENTDSNTNDLKYFLPINIDSKYGKEWKQKLFQPYVFRDINAYTDYKGPNTVLIIPLNPNTKGKRGGDYSAIVFKENIPTPIVQELYNYMIKTGILKQEILGPAKVKWCYLNSDDPKAFFSKTNIKKVLANFFKPKTMSPIKETDVNIRNFAEQDKNNTRLVKNYRENFIKCGRKFTVGHSTYEQNGVKKPMTVLLFPTKENTDDCVAVTIDNVKLSKEQANNLFNYLVQNNIQNSEDEMFRKAIVKYLNK